MQTYANPSRPANLQVGYLFGRGWETFKTNIGMSILIMLVFGFLTNLGGGYGSDRSTFQNLLGLVSFLIAPALTAGYNIAFLKMVRGEDVQFGMLFSGFSKFGRAFGVYYLMVISVVLGMVLLIVPGIIIGLGLIPAMYLVLDDDRGVIDTLKRAWEMTNGEKGKLFVVMLALLGFNILGVLALVVGVVVTITISGLIIAAAYDELAGESQTGTTFGQAPPSEPGPPPAIG